jgi:hypothetical protein
MKQSKMTMGQPVGAASHTTGGFSTVVRIGSKSLSSRVGLIRFESGRVLVFHGGVFECSSRMNGKPSSPVLRGLRASNGAGYSTNWFWPESAFLISAFRT